MARFLFIPGAWHGGSCFERLRAPLERAGHSMLTPDLPGAGGDARAMAQVSLEGWAQFIVGEARRQAEPVILCAHSRGGIIASQAAELAPEAFAALVYISGALIPDGQSLYDMIGRSMETGRFGAALSPVHGGLGLRFDPAAAAEFFYQLCSPEDQRQSAAQLIDEPVRPFSTALRLTAARFGRVPRHYIECAQDRTFPLDVQRAMQAVLPCRSVTTLQSDHSPFISMPETLAGALATIAEQE
ncbi:alpha/beta fold hydrolase [Sphingobium sp. B12D2B]|uniref:alpha/beta fold hydrolase n=1 Tax=Sphingobium sp. B12D2B TaxID=2940577 RepID=UPI002224CBB9|nr:alpha/beta fold hydrolase [Sphingobium sp. B12D2B]MCW2350374.1 pimeloyl-ACP methyl ester carboxylesterase [Sphingobium sp. B12D2B]